GAPSGGLCDHFDHRSHGIGVGLDVHPRVTPEADAEQPHGKRDDDEGRRQGLLHQPTHQSIPLKSSAPEMTTASPAWRPDLTGTGSPSLSSSSTRRRWNRSSPFSVVPAWTKTTRSSPTCRTALRGTTSALRAGAAMETVAYISGSSARSGLPSVQRRRAVRVTGSRVEEIHSMRPGKLRSGYAITFTWTGAPGFTRARSTS